MEVWGLILIDWLNAWVNEGSSWYVGLRASKFLKLEDKSQWSYLVDD
jgi:hypothetical protein